MDLDQIEHVFYTFVLNNLVSLINNNKSNLKYKIIRFKFFGNLLCKIE